MSEDKNNSANTEDSSPRVMVVIRRAADTVKGYLEPSAWSGVDELLNNARSLSQESLRLRLVESDAVEEISVADVKAVFYVNSFEGNPSHNHLNFHSRAPVHEGIWMRLEFLDGEVMEGIVYNSIRYLVDPGFFLLPTDPGSNNKLVYVVKSWLADHRVLGLRRL